MTKFLNLKEPFVLLLVGTPLSGKSTFTKDFSERYDFEVISRDDILMDEYLDMGYTDNNYSNAFKIVNQKNINKKLNTKINDLSISNDNVIIDMTNMTSKRRKETLSHFNNHNKYCLIFPILSKDEYEKRNIKRLKEENKSLDMNIISNMIKSYQPPSLSEGYKKIFNI